MQERKLRRGRRRRSERLCARLPLQLIGASATGLQFLENTETLTLSQFGASILTRQKLMPAQEVIIRRLDTNTEARVRIKGKIGERTDGCVYAVEFVDSKANLWEIEFATSFDLDKPEDLVFLVCNCCRNCEAVHLGESSFGEFETVHGVLLYCMHCQAMTRWMRQAS
jgi:hypothetical protein